MIGDEIAAAPSAVNTEGMTTDTHRPVIEMVVLVASAGGLASLTAVLRELRTELPAAVVVQQHLGGHDSVLPNVLARQTDRPIGWAQHGHRPAPGRVVVCPPGAHLEFSPHGVCRLRPSLAAGDHRFDVLLTSVAQSYGPRSVGVVLSGSGRDGAVGTAAMRRAGALVIAESPETARFASMPAAAARAGAGLVLRIEAIGRTLTALMDGAAVPDALVCALVDPRAPDRSPGPPPNFDEAWLAGAMSNAAGRAELARLRAAELARRRKALSSGSGVDARTAATAQRRAAESRRRAQLAHQAAAEAAARWGS